jgi:folate-binding protein YgfZ
MTSALQPADFIRDSAGVRARPELTALHVTGDDRREWLNGQLTNDVRHTKPGESVYGLAVNVRGKILADVWMLDQDSRMTLLVPETSLGTLLESFDSQIIMEDVELAHAPELRVLSVQGPRASEVVAGLANAFPGDELGHGGSLLIVPHDERAGLEARLLQTAAAHGGGPIAEADWELARLRAGRPRYGVDFDEKNYPQEAGLGTRAVSFQKGCYLGQEVICTLESRGRLSRQLVRVRVPGAAAVQAGEDVLDAAEAIVGRVTSVAVDQQADCTLALAYVKRALAVRDTQLRIGTSSAQLDHVIGE